MYEFRSEEGHQAAKKAMRLLEFSDRTRKELSQKLKRSGFSDDAISEAEEYLDSYNYLDDARYARQFILNRVDSKSRQVITQELKMKGVNDDLIQTAWLEIAEEMDLNYQEKELELIRGVVRKMNISDRAISIKEVRRLYGRLARKGFSMEDIRRVMEEENLEISYEE